MLKKKTNGSENIAVIYARYSSHAQRDVSIDQQLKACRTYANKLGLKVIEVYADRAMTGTNDRRPEFQRMIADAGKSTFAYIIVYQLDRFARDRYDSAVYKRQLKEQGVRVLSAMENISDDPSGILMESLLEGLAEYYSKELSQKIRRGMNDNASKCMVNGPVPLGYRKGADGKYEIVKNEADLIKEIYSRVAQGEAFVSIIDDLNQRGIKTKAGFEWNRSSFHTILKNERYLGIYIFGDYRIVGGIPAILDNELFNMVQYRLVTKKNPRNSPQKRRRENSVYLLTGKLYCGKCLSPMMGLSGKSSNPHYYYACKKRKLERACDKAYVQRDYIEREITIALKEQALQDKVIDWLADCVISYQAKNKETAELSALKEQLAGTERAIKNLISAMEQGIISEHTKSRLKELENEATLLSARISFATDDTLQNVSKEDMVTFLRSFREGDVNDKNYQALMFDTFLIRAYLFDDKVRIVFNYAGKNNTVELPFDIENIEGNCEASVRISSTELHQNSLIRTSYTIYMVKGLFVLDHKLQ